MTKSKPNVTRKRASIIDESTTSRIVEIADRESAQRIKLQAAAVSKYADLFRQIDAMKPGQSILIRGTEAESERVRNSVLVRAKRTGVKRFTTRLLDGALMIIRIDEGS